MSSKPTLALGTSRRALELDPRLVERGFTEHEVRLAEGRESGGLDLVVYWPKAAPGGLLVTLNEEDYVPRARLIGSGPGASPQEQAAADREGHAARPLARLRLHRGPDGQVTVSPTVDQLWRAPARSLRFTGECLQVTLRVRDDRARGDLATAAVGPIPLPFDPGVEGDAWEIAARGAFYAGVGADALPGLGAEGRALLEPAFAEVPRTTSLRFTLRGPDGAEQLVDDRWVFMLSHYPVRQGDRCARVLDKRLLHVKASEDGRWQHQDVHAATEALEFGGAGLPSLRRLKWARDAEGRKVREAKVSLGKKLGRCWSQRVLFGEQVYWLLDERFDAEHPDLLGPREAIGACRVVEGHAAKVEFALTSDWEAYHTRLRKLLEHLALIQAWQRTAERTLKKHAQELEAWSHVVGPLYGTFKNVKFHRRTADLRLLGCTLEEAKGPQLEQTKALQARVARIMERVRWHADKAFALWADPAFSREFRSRRHHGQTVVVGESADRLAFAREFQDGRFFDWVLDQQVLAKRYRYDDAFKLLLLNQVAHAFVLRAAVPGSAGGGQGAASKQYLADVRRRREQFRAHLGKPMLELMQASVGGETVNWLVGAVGKSNLPQAIAGGSFGLLLYGDDAMRRALTKDLLGIETPLWKIKGQDWPGLEGELRTKLGMDAQGKLGEGTLMVLSAIGIVLNVKDMLEGKWKHTAVLDVGEVVLGALELGLKTAQMLQPSWFAIEVQGALPIMKGPGVALQGLGRVLGVIAALKGAFDAWQVVIDHHLGYDFDHLKFTMSLLLMAAGLVMLVYPIAGAVIGCVLVVVDGLIMVFKETDLEGLLLWWRASPWGDGRDVPKRLSWERPKELFEEGVSKLNAFLKVLGPALDDAVKKKTMSAADKAAWEGFLVAWARANAKRYATPCVVNRAGGNLVFNVRST